MYDITSGSSHEEYIDSLIGFFMSLQDKKSHDKEVPRG